MASEDAYEALADEYKRVLDALGDQARHRFEALASKLDLRGPAARDRLVDALGVVVEGYADQATAAAEMYLQNLQGLGEAITWTAADPPDPRQIESIVGRALGEAGRGDVAAALATLGGKLHTANDFDAFVQSILSNARSGDHILVMSNGGFGGIHEKLLAKLAG